VENLVLGLIILAIIMLLNAAGVAFFQLGKSVAGTIIACSVIVYLMLVLACL